MAIEYNLTTDRVRTNAATLSDDSEVTDFIEAVVCDLTATDGAFSAYTDSWVSLTDASTVSPDDFVAFADMTELPDKIRTQLEAWGDDEERRQQLADQIAAKKIASEQKAPPWAA
jgi:hypothetical protein